MSQQSQLQTAFEEAVKGLVLENGIKHPEDWKTGTLPATQAQVFVIRTAIDGGVGDPSIIDRLMAWDQTAANGEAGGMVHPGTLTKGEASLWISQHIPGAS